jgi:hypothetical protein
MLPAPMNPMTAVLELTLRRSYAARTTLLRGVAGVWQQLHELLLAELNAAGALDWSRAVIDSSHVRALKGGPKPGQARSIVPGPARSTT